MEPAAIWGALAKMKTKLLESGMALCFLGGCGSKEPDCGSNATVSAVKANLKEHKNNRLIVYVFDNSEQYKMAIGEPFISRNINDDPDLKKLYEQRNNAKAKLRDALAVYFGLKKKCYKNELNIKNDAFTPYALSAYCGGLPNVVAEPDDVVRQFALYENTIHLNSQLLTDGALPKSLDAAQRTYYEGLKTAYKEAWSQVAEFAHKIESLNGQIIIERQRFPDKEARRKAQENTERRAKLESMWQKAISSAIYNLDVIRALSKDTDVRAVSCTAKFAVTVRDWGSAEGQANYMAQYTSDGKLYVEVGL